MKTVVMRGNYGEIVTGTGLVFDRAKSILQIAQKNGQVDAPYDETKWSRKHGRHIGNMLNVDIYDVAPGAVLVQYRYLNMTKYGTGCRKEYILIKRTKGRVTAEDRASDKPRIMKLAKSGLPVGGVIDAITGKKPAKIKVMPVQKSIGYKALVLDNHGNLVSVWDGSLWSIGKTRIEAATPDHKGGFYCYRCLDECVAAARNSKIFGDARDHDNLVLVEVETSGKTFKHSGEKICTTRMKITRILGSLDDFG